MPTVVINNETYTLATTLRVAYNVQKQHNHKSYMEIFKNVDSMSLEDQIGIIYESAKVGSPEMTITRNDFLEAYLDNHNVGDIMESLNAIFKGILGKDLSDKAEAEIAQGTVGE